MDFRYSEVKAENPAVIEDAVAVASKLTFGLETYEPSEKATQFVSGIFR